MHVGDSNTHTHTHTKYTHMYRHAGTGAGCKDKMSGYSSFFGTKGANAKFADHTGLMAHGKIKQLSLYFSPDEGCVKGAKAVFGQPDGHNFPGMIGSSAKTKEAALKLGPKEWVVKVEYKMGRCDSSHLMAQ